MNKIFINSEGDYQINDIMINNKIFDEELYPYRIEEREEIINNLVMWISQTTKDKGLMMEDLKYLINLPNKYVFSSIETNEYIAISDNKEEFDKICFDLLELSKEVEENVLL